MSVNGKTRAELIALPVRKWDDTSRRYDSLLVMADGKKHGSGWGLILVIGCVDFEPVEIASACADDINWNLSMSPQMDCALPSRALHFWYRKPGNPKGLFRVGCALSSTDVYGGYAP